MFPCTVIGLVSKSHLNNSAATVLSYDHSRARYKVLLEGKTDPVFLKPENIFTDAADASVTSRHALVQKHAQMLTILTQSEAMGNREAVAAFCSEVGTTLKNMELYEEAMSYHRRAIEITKELQKTAGSADERSTHRANEGVFTSNLAIALRRLGQLEQAVDCLELAIHIGQETGQLLNQG
eukprot:3297296-Prymnesium_polylepis.1